MINLNLDLSRNVNTLIFNRIDDNFYTNVKVALLHFIHTTHVYL